MAKKIAPFIILVAVIALAFFFSAKQNSPTQSEKDNQSVDITQNSAQKDSHGSSNSNTATDSAILGGTTTNNTGENQDENAESENMMTRDERPAAEAYKTADEALAAVKAGSKDYDDLILQQFTTPGEDCSWCESFYSSLKTLMIDPSTSSDQRSYFAELLSISGKVENIQALVDAIKSAPTPDIADQYSEALELTVGKKDVTDFLGTLLNNENQSLKESAVAAITNQGSREAAELLYKHTIEKGDPDGYYSVGIGLGEFVPDEASMPYIQELMLKRDQYSHLATKSLLNSGDDGLKLVFDALSSSKSSDFDKQMLKDALDHVNMGDETKSIVEGYLKTSQQPVLQEFGKQILEELNQEQEQSDDAEQQDQTEDQTPEATENEATN